MKTRESQWDGEKRYGRLPEKTRCSGCGACVHSCPAGAISMEADGEGFLYPRMDEAKCVGCGKCESLCPALRPADAINWAEPACYAVQAEDRVRMGSSSGGMFTLLARETLSRGGVVCGACMDRDFQVYHTLAEKERDLEPLRRSKYVQSDLRKVFPEIRDCLEKERWVLFVGTPCQAAGLRAFLGREWERLLIVDLVCSGVISPKVFERYLEETFGKKNIKHYYFRTKIYGYDGLVSACVLKNGQTYMGHPSIDPLVRGRYRNLFARPICQDCPYASFPRQGDLTLGDFWGLSSYRKEWTDEKGTSLVLVNNEKGRHFLEEIRKRGKIRLFQEAPLEIAVKKNRFGTHKEFHSQRERFFEMLDGAGVHKAVEYCLDGRYDVGLLGVWFGCNYGSIATYYGLKCQLEKLGMSVLMIDKPGHTEEDRELAQDSHSRIFAGNHFHVSRRYQLWEMRRLNQICDAFVVGSDQVWNYGVGRAFGKSFLLDFAREEKKKVAVAASFGHDRDFRPVKERAADGRLLSRFDWISVREESGVEILKRDFGVEGVQILDPVFSTDRQVYDAVAAESRRREREPYLLTYILDPTPEKREAIGYLAEKLGRRPLHILDGTPWNFQENREKMGMETILEDITFPDWVWYFQHADFVLTDSCHGMSFAILYRKNFIAMGNTRRGMTRFESLAHLLHMEHRLVREPSEILRRPELLEDVDYRETERILARKKQEAEAWLKKAMFSPKSAKTSQVYAQDIRPRSREELYVAAKDSRRAEPGFLLRFYYRLPSGLQKQAKKIWKAYRRQEDG